MITREFNAHVIMICDGCADGFLETGEMEIEKAMPVARKRGWTVGRETSARNAGGDWDHFCPDCSADGPPSHQEAVTAKQLERKS